MTSFTSNKTPKRYALVIGNSNYRSKKLPCCINDANQMANCLRQCNFKVTKETDLTSKQMKEALETFEKTLGRLGLVDEKDTALFYFAGHGGESDSKMNSYLGTDGETGLNEEDVQVMLQKKIHHPEGHKIIITDACRSRPPGLTVARGSPLSIINKKDPASARNVLHLASTVTGATAGEHSKGVGLGYFTSVFTEMMLEPGIEWSKLCENVRNKLWNVYKQMPEDKCQTKCNDFFFLEDKKPPPRHEPSSSSMLKKPAPSASWPGQTKAGRDCKNCLKKGQGIFCHLHQTGDQVDDMLEGVTQSVSSMSLRSRATSKKPAPSASWPGQTKAGGDCKNCLKKGQGIFCHLHNK
jgi:hypothetical protein